MKAGLAMGLVIPDLWQQEAIRALQQGKDVVVQAPTGSGKTYIFELFYPDLKGQAVFTVPTRALANDKLAPSRARGRVVVACRRRPAAAGLWRAKDSLKRPPRRTRPAAN
jgi:superfamily II DNA helicase RecQ